MQPNWMNRDWLHWAFEASLLAKGVLAAIETLSGLVLLIVSHGQIADLAHALTAHELSEDPNDLVAGTLMHMAQAFSVETQKFYALYLLSHGGLKLGVVGLLARGLIWAYPAAIVLMGVFIAYQLHVWAGDRSVTMLALTALDVAVIALTWREWRRKRGLSFPGNAA